MGTPDTHQEDRFSRPSENTAPPRKCPICSSRVDPDAESSAPRGDPVGSDGPPEQDAEAPALPIVIPYATPEPQRPERWLSCLAMVLGLTTLIPCVGLLTFFPATVVGIGVLVGKPRGWLMAVVGVAAAWAGLALMIALFSL